jgi:hypothetical protein
MKQDPSKFSMDAEDIFTRASNVASVMVQRIGHPPLNHEQQWNI